MGLLLPLLWSPAQPSLWPALPSPSPKPPPSQLPAPAFLGRSWVSPGGSSPLEFTAPPESGSARLRPSLIPRPGTAAPTDTPVLATLPPPLPVQPTDMPTLDTQDTELDTVSGK